MMLNKKKARPDVIPTTSLFPGGRIGNKSRFEEDLDSFKTVQIMQARKKPAKKKAAYWLPFVPPYRTLSLSASHPVIKRSVLRILGPFRVLKRNNSKGSGSSTITKFCCMTTPQKRGIYTFPIHTREAISNIFNKLGKYYCIFCVSKIISNKAYG